MWSMRFQQRYGHANPSESSALPPSHDHVLKFSSPSVDLAFDDVLLDHVKAIWQKIVGDEAGEFLVFEDREDEAAVDEDDS
jgi:Rab proteins geranylgeranyltransferase component A